MTNESIQLTQRTRKPLVYGSTPAALANGGVSEKRRNLDFYPTPPEGTVALLHFLTLPPCTIWEPASGDGAMSRVLQKAGHRVISTDINQECFGEGGVNYLTAAPRECDAIITNPPFEISEQFIRKAVTEAPLVAMLLKSQYWHAAKRQKLFLEHPPSWILPLTWRLDFLNGERGGSPTMECIWTVWTRDSEGARYIPLAKPRNDSNMTLAV